MKKNMPLQLAILLACQLSIYSLTGCTKDKVNSKNEIPTSKIENHEKVLAFLSRSLNVPVDRIKTDPSSGEFYIPETSFRIKISETYERYNSANIYKAQYEK